MKLIITTATALLVLLQVQAQIPTGYAKGTILLADGTTLAGYLHDNIKKNAAVVFVDEKGENKTVYNSTEINGVQIDSNQYIALKGDFFKTICNGKIIFLQKASNSSGKTIYNGSQAIVLPGTEGKIGDYFAYTNQQLTLINKKTVDAFIATELATCTAAVDKAKTINGNMAALAEAVSIYNSQVK